MSIGPEVLYPERSVFPIQKRVADLVLSEIRKDPEGIHDAELSLLGMPLIGYLLNKVGEIEDGSTMGGAFSITYSHGFTSAHLMLRRQADVRGIPLPEVTDESLLATVESMYEDRRQGDFGQVFDEALGLVATTDPHFYDTISSMYAHTLFKPVFILGATDLRRFFEGKEDSDRLTALISR